MLIWCPVKSHQVHKPIFINHPFLQSSGDNEGIAGQSAYPIASQKRTRRWEMPIDKALDPDNFEVGFTMNGINGMARAVPADDNIFNKQSALPSRWTTLDKMPLPHCLWSTADIGQW
jgi:hypothetical protein